MQQKTMNTTPPKRSFISSLFAFTQRAPVDPPAQPGASQDQPDLASPSQLPYAQRACESPTGSHNIRSAIQMMNSKSPKMAAPQDRRNHQTGAKDPHGKQEARGREDGQVRRKLKRVGKKVWVASYKEQIVDEATLQVRNQGHSNSYNHLATEAENDAFSAFTEGMRPSISESSAFNTPTKTGKQQQNKEVKQQETQNRFYEAHVSQSSSNRLNINQPQLESNLDDSMVVPVIRILGLPESRSSIVSEVGILDDKHAEAVGSDTENSSAAVQQPRQVYQIPEPVEECDIEAMLQEIETEIQNKNLVRKKSTTPQKQDKTAEERSKLEQQQRTAEIEETGILHRQVSQQSSNILFSQKKGEAMKSRLSSQILNTELLNMLVGNSQTKSLTSSQSNLSPLKSAAKLHPLTSSFNNQQQNIAKSQTPQKETPKQPPQPRRSQEVSKVPFHTKRASPNIKIGTKIMMGSQHNPAKQHYRPSGDSTIIEGSLGESGRQGKHKSGHSNLMKESKTLRKRPQQFVINKLLSEARREVNRGSVRI